MMFSRFIPLLFLAPVSTVCMAQATLSPQAQLMLRGQRPATRTGQTEATEKKLTAYVTLPDGTLTTCHATPSELSAMAASAGATHIHLTSGPQPMLDKARSETGVKRIHDGENLAQSFTGKNVVVGIVDAGFDYTHPAFRRPSDGALRIVRVWEQGTASYEGCTPPAAFGYGVEMLTADAILGAQADATVNSHGTHVAAIAAGSDTFMDGAWQGVAPDADIVLVGLDQSTATHADISNAVKYIFDYADEVGKPCVVNLSLGNHDGPHDGTSPFDRMADDMQGPGRIIVGAAGNHQKDKFHIHRSFASAEDDALRTFITHKVAPTATQYGGTVQLWVEKGAEVEVELSAYSLFNKKDMVSVPVYPAEGVQSVKLGSYATGTLEVASGTDPENGKLNIVVNSALTSVRNNYAVALTVRPKSGGDVNIWADNTWLQLDDKDIDGFCAPADASTIAEIGGTGQRILTVGAYVTRNDFKTLSATGTLDETLGGLASFSSRGPTADGRTKPEIAAPGCYIISALSAFDLSGTKQVAYTTEDTAHEYGYMQGTSMSAPFVAGTVATWLEANPSLTPEDVKRIATETARTDDFTGTLPEGGNCLWGAGKLDAYTGLLKCIEASAIPSLTQPLRMDMAYCNGMLSVIFPEDVASATVTVASAAGAVCGKAVLTNVKAGEIRSLPLAHLPKGMYVIRVENRHGSQTVKKIL